MPYCNRSIYADTVRYQSDSRDRIFYRRNIFRASSIFLFLLLVAAPVSLPAQPQHSRQRPPFGFVFRTKRTRDDENPSSGSGSERTDLSISSTSILSFSIPVSLFFLRSSWTTTMVSPPGPLTTWPGGSWPPWIMSGPWTKTILGSSVTTTTPLPRSPLWIMVPLPLPPRSPLPLPAPLP